MKYEEALRAQLGREFADELSALSHRVIGCAIEVHRGMGPGYLEHTYQAALEAELSLANISFQSQVPVALSYKGFRVGEYRFDIVVEDKLLLELKAVDSISRGHMAQAIAYLKAGQLPVGLILNFNAPTMLEGLRRVSHPAPKPS